MGKKAYISARAHIGNFLAAKIVVSNDISSKKTPSELLLLCRVVNQQHKKTVEV